MEVQAHGNKFEDMVIRKISKISKTDYEKLIPNAYTSPMDIHEGVRSKFNASVKSTGGNSIGLGDILSFYDHATTTPFKMIVGQWEQATATEKVFHTVYEFEITPDIGKMLFGDMTRRQLLAFRKYVKSIPDGKQGQSDNQKLWKEKRSRLVAKTNPIVKIDAKIDSKTQRRVQSSVGLTELLDMGIPNKRFRTKYRGIQLPATILSGARTFA